MGRLEVKHIQEEGSENGGVMRCRRQRKGSSGTREKGRTLMWYRFRLVETGK